MQHQRPQQTGILILDFGSQYTLLIARRLREIGIYSEIIDGNSGSPPDGFECSGIILSGGPDSVNESESRRIPQWVLPLNKPVLGICYGMQLLIENFQGSLRSGTKREYGQTTIHRQDAPHTTSWPMFSAMPSETDVWMSHGDDLERMPEHFTATAVTSSGVVAAMAHDELPLVGLQFHPEVEHSQYGKELLRHFVSDICGSALTWKPANMLHATLRSVRETVGDGKILMAVSGGVDSTVAAVLMARALGNDKVTPVFVDHGLLRLNEAEWVTEKLRLLGLDQLVVLDRRELFLSQLGQVSDPEKKRKIIGKTFIDAFEAYAKNQSGQFTHLGQGTLYPDVIESAGHGSGAKVIKSHHNVGGLPETLALSLVEPFRFCFKDEVRRIGTELGIPHELIHRHPFPGPGLAVRILGNIDSDKIQILQKADHIFVEELKAHGWYEQIWQAFAVLLPVKSVGVMGDNRTYQWTCALRAVTGTDAMTAKVADLPISFLTMVADKIVRQVDGINRVTYDVTTKPPATIEWE